MKYKITNTFECTACPICTKWGLEAQTYPTQSYILLTFLTSSKLPYAVNPKIVGHISDRATPISFVQTLAFE